MKKKLIEVQHFYNKILILKRFIWWAPQSILSSTSPNIFIW